MKAPFKTCNEPRHRAILSGLALAISLLAILPASAQTTNAPSATPPTSATAAADMKNISSAASTSSTADQDALSDYNNWVTLGIGATFVTGDHAQFQREQDTKSGVFGGVQDFHWQEFVGKNGSFTMDGHALVGDHDYDIHLDYTDPTLGYLRAGYTEYRTWYDGNGGYYPLPKAASDLTFSPYDNDLSVDRRSGWIEAGLTLPDLPVMSFRYEYDSRIGMMDSTSWGPTSLTAGGGSIYIVPTFLSIDETRNIFLGNITDKVDNTDMGLTLRYELDETKDGLFSDQNPGQSTNTFLTDYDVERNDIFNVHGFQETFFNDKVTFSSGFSYVNVDTNLGGSRVYGPTFNTTYYSPASNTHQYINLNGLGSTNEYVFNLNLALTPIKDLVITPAVRFEYDGSNLADGASISRATNTEYPAGATANTWTTSVAESLEARYTGFRDWSLYASGEWSEDWGNDDWDEVVTTTTPILAQEYSRLCQKYTIGANWYPLSNLNFGGQFYHQMHDYSYTGANVVPQYAGYLKRQDFTTDDMNIRATWQALSNVTLVTRYDFQYSTVDTTSVGDMTGVAIGPQGTVQSSNITDHIISEDASWSPFSQLCLQAGGSYVIDNVTTPVAGSGGINNLVPNSEDDYWTVDASASYAIDNNTDLRLQYTYYRADDYMDNANTSANGGLPLGADTEEHNVSATLTHKFNKSLEGSLKYAYSRYRDGLAGGQDDYESHLVYASMKYGF